MVFTPLLSHSPTLCSILSPDIFAISKDEADTVTSKYILLLVSWRKLPCRPVFEHADLTKRTIATRRSGLLIAIVAIKEMRAGYRVVD